MSVVTPDIVARLQANSDFQGLLSLKEAAKGPVPSLLVAQALAQCYDSSSQWSESVHQWRDCLSHSPSDPQLWDHFGDAAWKSGRYSLAISSYQNSYALNPNLTVLLKVAQTRLRIHDYANALALTSYILSMNPDLKEAEETRSVVVKVLQGQELYHSGCVFQRTELRVDFEKVELKPANLMALAKALRKLLETNKTDCVIALSKGVLKEQNEAKNPASRSLPKRFSALNVLIEEIKSTLLSLCDPPSFPHFGLHPLPPIPCFKSRSQPEPLFFTYLDQEWRPRVLLSRLIRDLCGNNPRPSPALSDSLGWEIVHLYLINDGALDLGNEVLTLFEVALKGREMVGVLDKLHEAASTRSNLYTTQELRLRFSHAEAWFYYYIGEQKGDINQQKSALSLAYHRAEETESMLSDSILYLWWSGKVVSQGSLTQLKDSIRDELLLLKLEEAVPTKTVKLQLTLFGALIALLTKRVETDDPGYYCKRAKVFLKSIVEKWPISESDQPLFTASLKSFLSVILYHMEEGYKLGKDVDLKLLMQAARCVYMRNNAAKVDSTSAAVALSVLNLVKLKPEFVSELPRIIRRVVKDRKTRVKYFSQIHKICCKFTKNESDFHLCLCREFEKDVYVAGSKPQQRVVSTQLYGLHGPGKGCSCGLGKLVPGEGVPKSNGELKRVIDYVESVEPVSCSALIYKQPSYSKEVFPVFARMLTGLPVPCPLLASVQKSIPTLLENGPTAHSDTCCPKDSRLQYSRLLLRMASDSLDIALNKELKPSFLSLLDTAETYAEKLLILDSESPHSWLLLGQVYLHQWLSGYFDPTLLGYTNSQYSVFAASTLRCFQVMEALDPTYTWFSQLVHGLVSFCEYRITGAGLFEAERLLYAAAQSPSASLEAVLIAGICELHMKSEKAEELFATANQSNPGQYEGLIWAARWKMGKIEPKELESWAGKDRYVAYLLSKVSPSSDYLPLIHCQRMMDFKVMDRCLMLPKKQVKLAERLCAFYIKSKETLKLVTLFKEIGEKNPPIWVNSYEKSGFEVGIYLKDVSFVEEVRVIYDLMSYVEGKREGSCKKQLQEVLAQALLAAQHRFGLEKCEEMRPVKRRRKKQQT